MLIGLFVAVILLTGASAQTFKAGFGKRDITPQGDNIPMWGYGARHDMPAKGTRDPLYAKALVLEVGDETIALVGLDLGRAPTFRSMAIIREHCRKGGVEHILLSGSHTHHGPVIELLDEEGYGKGKFDEAIDYVADLERNVTAAILEARENAVPAKIGWAMEDTDLNRNRHTKIQPKPTDPELAVLKLESLDGDPIAILVNFAAHPTIADILDRRWTSEWPGQMQNTVEAALGTNCFFMQGAAGDMSPNTNDSRRGVDGFGKAFGEKVVELAKTIEPTVPETPEILVLPEEKFAFETRIDLDNPLIVGTFKQMFFPEITAMLEELPNNTIYPRLNTALINGELALATGSGEFFCEHANRLKAESAAHETLFIGYCNGHQMYFPTEKAVEEGGYGADPSVSWVPPTAGKEMIDKALVNIEQLVGMSARK
jgi:hypothetical protein